MTVSLIQSLTGIYVIIFPDQFLAEESFSITCLRICNNTSLYNSIVRLAWCIPISPAEIKHNESACIRLTSEWGLVYVPWNLPVRRLITTSVYLTCGWGLAFSLQVKVTVSPSSTTCALGLETIVGAMPSSFTGVAVSGAKKANKNQNIYDVLYDCFNNFWIFKLGFNVPFQS